MNSSPQKQVVSKLFNAAKAILLDFDGTLVDSNPIKLKAFDACFARFTKEWPEIKAYCYSNNHTPRWDKFRYVYEHILRQPYSADIEGALLHTYATASTQPVKNAPEIPGAADFLRSQSKVCPLVIVSSTPDPILKDLLRHRRWDAFVKESRGAPVNKAEWMASWCGTQGWNPTDLVFVGDSLEDLQASRQAGIPFVALVNPDLEKESDGFLKDWTEWKTA